ncbi:MAG: porin [Cellvibrio sp.]|uniref:OprO/OprP family phosphate-selective porin n=1 Tax=Cellvibrio sp. TaxID=1965322 RepID=UPI00271C1701|nr:porin [Cellvibrio sp.]
MKISRYLLAVTAVLGPGASSGAFALDLYMDTETTQIYAKPGPNRIFMGTFDKVQNAPAKTADNSNKLDKAEITAIREDLALKTKEIKALKESSTEAVLVKSKFGDNGLEIETKDGDFKMAIGGDLQLDGQMNNNGDNIPQSAQLNDGAGIRRGRIHMQGTAYKDFNYRYEYDFVRGSGSTAAGITDAWIEYTGLRPISFTVGQFREPFSLESVTNYKYLTFIERSAPNNAFVEWANPFLMGISAQTFGERYTARGAFQIEPIGNGNFVNNTSLNSNGNANRNGQSGNPSHGITGRATFLPIYNSKTELLHIGASGSYRKVNNISNGVADMSFASWVGNVDRSNWANTGGLTDPVTVITNRRILENFSRVGAEISGVYGPASFQGEYMRTQLSGQNYDSNDHLDGYYAYASYFLTGESRNYDTKKGTFGLQKPNRNFDFKNGGPGAWELAARFDSLDMNTAHVAGGFLQTGTVALNWYLNPHVRFMADYAHVFTNKTIDTGFTKVMPALATSGQHPDIFMTRAQVDW